MPCEVCKVPLLPRIVTGSAEGNDWWCSRCGRLYVSLDRRAPLVAFRPMVASDLASRSTVRWEGRLHEDCSITFTITGKGSADEARAAALALHHLANCAEERARHLRGAHRWIFRRDPESGVYWVRHDDTDRALMSWTAGTRKPGRQPEKCEACSRQMPTGTKGYRVDRSVRGRGWYGGSWSYVRLCTACVEAAPAATGHAHLRAIDGGKGKEQTG